WTGSLRMPSMPDAPPLATAAPPPPGAPAPGAYLAPSAVEADPEQAEHLTPEYWTKELAAARRWLQKWHARARVIERKYLLQDQEANAAKGESSRFPLFWSNVQ